MKRLFALLVVIVFAACSGDNGTEPTNNNNGGGGGGGGSVTHDDSVRVVTVRALTDRLNQWHGSSADTIAARASRYLKSLPNIGAAGISEETTVWATFKDGVALIIPNNRETSSPADTLLDERMASAPKSVAAPRHVAIPAGRRMMRALRIPQSGHELPVSNKFRALNPIGTCHDDPLPVIKSLLRKGHYVDVHPGAATVEELEAVRGEGVFYINTHGGLGADADGHTLYGLWTATPYNSVTAPVYASQLKSSELVIMVAYSDSLGNCQDVAHIGFTSRFVTKYMKFGKQSLVIVDACSGASENASWMRDAFAHAGASVYVGWSRTVGGGFAYRSMKYLLDRLLGINVISPEDPKQRAFNIDQVLNDMRVHHNLVEDPTYHGVLSVFHLKDDFGLLAPTIQFLSLDDNGEQPKLIIAGLFGTDPGEGKRSVTINGTELANVDWYPTEINCDIDESGANASGTVVVKVGSGGDARESNHVNITAWEGEMTYEREDPGDQKAEMKIKVRFLADIHDFRDEPGEDPFKTTVLFTARRETNVKATTSGSYTRPEGDCTEKWTLGQGGELKTPFEGADGSWSYFGSVDTQSHKLQLNMAILCVFKAGTWSMTGPLDRCENFNRTFYAALALEDCLYDLKIQAPAFLMDMDDKFVVIGDQRGPCSVEPLVGKYDDLTAQATLKWTEMNPDLLPDPDAAR
jgi:hypothetical protein